MAYDTDTIVEATSLSHVSSIAANPPPHPLASIDGPRLPLVLYIARVPGSRDVFLTPIKPREKIVTAEDVQSSLYFVHVNCLEDFEQPSRRTSSVDTDASALLSFSDQPIQRKPALPARSGAPPTPPYPTDEVLPTRQPLQQPALQRSSIARKPVGAAAPSKQQLEPPVLSRRPLPAPPRDEQPYNHSLHAENVRLLRHEDHSPENNPYIRQYEAPPSPIDPSLLPEPGSITLIRRDPSSNEQWDVASIHDPPVHEVSSAALLNPSAAKRTKRGGAPLYLDISNPGYSQFISTDRPGLRISSSSSNSADSDPPPDGVFRRRLYMPGSKYGEHVYGHHALSSSVGSLDHGNDVSMPRRIRNSVDMSMSSSTTPVSDRRSKSYTFKSPWDGRCEFSTGATGKSLKCKHHLEQQQGGGVQEVSELRFNLPTKSSKTATVLSEKRSSYFHRLHGHSEEAPHTPTFIFGEDGKLDLTLGQEKAGGGLGGKQAKLGKLIIESEGLKMLDLLVAANIGLWWRAYDKL